VSFLAGRKKAAVAAAGDGLVIALLPEAPPESGLEGTTAACFFAEGGGGGAKRPRDDADAGPGFDAFPALDLVEGAGRDAAVSALPAWNKKTARRDDAEAMVFRGDDGGCVFFQDARRKYEFACGAAGLRLLAGLVARTKVVLALNARALARLPADQASKLLDEGRRIYGEKPSLRKFAASDGQNKNVTWSDDEYGHLGLQAQYLKLKSFQRFTETYNMCARACAADGYARRVLLESPALRVASLGGGPAFELDALREFCHAACPTPPKLAMYSLDLQPGWGPYANALGCHFVAPLDVSTATPKSIVRACGDRPIDVMVISYLFIYCTDARTADLMHHLLVNDLVKVLFVSERTENQDIVGLLEQRGLAVVPLLPQRSKDQRQLLVLDPKRRERTAGEPDLAFPNVPFARGT